VAETKRKGRGGKLARTEVVQVRLDPKLRFAAELAAAKERRTLSSFVEWAVEHAVRMVRVYGERDLATVRSAEDVANAVWDVDEADRFVKLASNYPELLTHDEARRWKFITETRAFWRKPAQGALEPNLPAIREAWGMIVEHIEARQSFDWGSFAFVVEEEGGIAVEYEDPEPTPPAADPL